MTAASCGTEKETSIRWVPWQLFQGKTAHWQVGAAKELEKKENGRTEKPE